MKRAAIILKILLPTVCAVMIFGLVAYNLAHRDSHVPETVYDLALSENVSAASPTPVPTPTPTPTVKGTTTEALRCRTVIDKTPYNTWLGEGNHGADEDFLVWIKEKSHFRCDCPTVDKTPYNTWRDAGKNGNESEFINWIKEHVDKEKNQLQSTPAPESKVAYNTWLEAGNQGSEADFSVWIKETTNFLAAMPGNEKPSLFPTAKFEPLVVEYDGQPHTITVSGVSPDVEVLHVNNTATDIGTYRAFAHLSQPNLGERIMTTTLTIKKVGISGITFDDTTVVYDGEIKDLKVSGNVPDGVTVKYFHDGAEFEGAAEAGSYQITAVLSGNNYQDLTLTAVLNIQKADITKKINFGNKTVEYDGAVKTIALGGNLPADASVTYTNEDGSKFTGATIPGEYLVKAIIKGGANYNNHELQATLTITKGIIRNITFVDKTEKYDGTLKTISVTGTLPPNVSVSYALLGGSPFDGATEAKSYYVTATLTGEHYQTEKLTAYLYIVQNQLDKPTGLTLGDTSGNQVYLSWNKVDKASAYKLQLYDIDNNFLAESETTKETTFNVRGWLVDLKLYAGEYSFKVIAIPSSLNAQSYAQSDPSDETATFNHEAGKLPTPQNVRNDNGVIRWNTVPKQFVAYLAIVPVDTNGVAIEEKRRTVKYLASDKLSLTTIKNDTNLEPGNYRFAIAVSPSSTMPNGMLAENVNLRSDFSEYTEVVAIE